MKRYIFFVATFLLMACGGPNTSLNKEPKQVEQKNWLVCDTLIVGVHLFELGKESLNEYGHVFIDSLVKRDWSTVDSVLVTNHADERYSDVYSFDLTEHRAARFAEAMKSRLEVPKIKIKGYRDKLPIIKNAKTPEEHQVNRRTEIIVWQKVSKRRKGQLWNLKNAENRSFDWNRN